MKLSWFGFKRLIRNVLLLSPINAIIREMMQLYPLQIRYRIPLTINQTTYETREGKKIFLQSPDLCDIAREIYWSGGVRRKKSDKLVMYCFEYFVSKSDLMIDIGAYSGFFSCVAAITNTKICVYSYEILPSAYLLLWKNIISNNAVGNIKPSLCGISDSPSSIIMPLIISGSVLPSSLSLGSKFKRGITIPVTTIDSQIEVEKYNHCVIKIDVEGYEKNVLLGAKRILFSLRPDIICEILPDSVDYMDIEQQLLLLSYNFFQFTDEGLLMKEKLIPDNAGRDWLFTTKTEEEIYWLISYVNI